MPEICNSRRPCGKASISSIQKMSKVERPQNPWALCVCGCVMSLLGTFISSSFLLACVCVSCFFWVFLFIVCSFLLAGVVRRELKETTLFQVLRHTSLTLSRMDAPVSGHCNPDSCIAWGQNYVISCIWGGLFKSTANQKRRRCYFRGVPYLKTYPAKICVTRHVCQQSVKWTWNSRSQFQYPTFLLRATKNKNSNMFQSNSHFSLKKHKLAKSKINPAVVPFGIVA